MISFEFARFVQFVDRLLHHTSLALLLHHPTFAVAVLFVLFFVLFVVVVAVRTFVEVLHIVEVEIDAEDVLRLLQCLVVVTEHASLLLWLADRLVIIVDNEVVLFALRFLGAADASISVVDLRGALLLDFAFFIVVVVCLGVTRISQAWS